MNPYNTCIDIAVPSPYMRYEFFGLNNIIRLLNKHFHYLKFLGTQRLTDVIECDFIGGTVKKQCIKFNYIRNIIVFSAEHCTDTGEQLCGRKGFGR